MTNRQKETGSPELVAYQQQRLQGFIADNSKHAIKDPIVFVGDSITEFFSLKKYLGRDLPLINRGIAGTDSLWLLEHLKEQVLALKPRKIFLMIGVNDLGRAYTRASIVERISQIIATIKVELLTTSIYLMSVLPVNESEPFADKVKIRNNKDIQALNQDLSVLAGIEFLDLYPILLDNEGNLAATNTSDGLHLTPEAYAKIAERIQLDLM